MSYLGSATAVAAVAAWLAGGVARAGETPPPVELHVPRTPDRVVIDAEPAAKKLWEADAGTTRNLKDAAGKGMVPYSEAKVRWGRGMLYLLLYAGDLDLEGTVKKTGDDVEKDDAFHLEFGVGATEVRTVAVSVLGTEADRRCTVAAPEHQRACKPGWKSGARIAVDRDGTLNKVGDNDEEWVVEMAIPLASLGVARARPGTRIPFSVRRCEIGRDGRHACGSWGADPRGELVLDP